MSPVVMLRKGKWMKHKAVISFLFLPCIILLLSACGGGGGNKATLSDEDKKLLDEVDEDIVKISDDNYVETVTSINSSPSEYAGKLIQIEGMVSTEQIHDEGMKFLYRNYQDGGEQEKLGIIVRYLPEETKEGDWVKATGVVTVEEDGDHVHAFLDVVTAETPGTHGPEDVK